MNYDEMLKQMKKAHEERMNFIKAGKAEEQRRIEELQRQEAERTKKIEDMKKSYELQQEKARKDYDNHLKQQQKEFEKAKKEQQQRVEYAREQFAKDQEKKNEVYQTGVKYKLEEEAALRGETSNSSSSPSGSAVKTVSGANIFLSADKLLANKNDLNNIAKEIQSSWDSIKNTELVNIQNSWAGSDAKVYIDKINALDSKVKASINAINLLSKTFDSAANTLQETQRNATSNLSSI